MKAQESPFFFTTYSWHEIKIDCALFSDLLENYILINNYGQDIEKILFAFVALPPISAQNFAYKKPFYSKKRRTLEGERILNFEKMMQANENEARQIQAEAYLDFILEIPKARGIKQTDFDAKKFYEDVKKLFVEHGFISEKIVKL